MMFDPRALRYYLVLDPDLCGGMEGLIETAHTAAKAGITMVQLRAPQWKKRAWYEAALRLMEVLAPFKVPLIINDQVDVALATHAHGVHIGQSDLPISVVRELLGPHKIIGLSISYPDEMRDAELQYANYLGVGPVFATTSKSDANPAIGWEGVKTIQAMTTLPMVAIGGLKPMHEPMIRELGLEGSAVISAVCGQPDVLAASQAWINA